MNAKILYRGAAVAAFLILSAGGMVAATAQTASDVDCKGCVGSKDVQNNSLTSKDIKDSSLGGRDIKDGTITGSDLKDGSVGAADLGSTVFPAVGISASNGIDDFTTTTFTSVLDATLSAPIDGYALIIGSVSAEDDLSLAGAGFLRGQLTVDDTVVTPDFYEMSTNEAQDVLANSMTLNIIVPVTAGDHTLSLKLRESGSGSFITGRMLTAVFLNGATLTVAPPMAAGSSPILRNRR